ncbi:hypothetical protein [Pseudomonas sp. EA_35y_Pfl2_R5]|uniref:hypothetical protein n=1 Tax=Pseudomonas sp. EA_35y_Pfl2_R5 TaxID=3088690 RepID=UPI0030D998F4
MKKVIAFLLSLFGSQASADQELHESSMNFDMENVHPFIEKLNTELALQLKAGELTNAISQTPVDSESTFTLEINYAGKKQKLILKAYMDDVDAPDLYFFSPSAELASSISSAMDSFVDERDL